MSKEDFFQAITGARPALLWRTVSSDLYTPVAAFLAIARRDPYAYLFESVEGGKHRGRYSFFGCQPDMLWRCQGGKATVTGLQPSGEATCKALQSLAGDPFASLRRLQTLTAMPLPAGVASMAAGLFGTLGYDMVRLSEHLPSFNPDTLDMPEALLLRPTLTGVFDHVRDELTLCAVVYPADDVDADRAWQEANSRLEEALGRLRQPLPAEEPAVNSSTVENTSVTSSMSKEAYCAAVRRAVEYVHAGDVFQVVPSQRFSRHFDGDPFRFYRRLRRLNPSPYLFYLQLDDCQLVGSSPEILVRLQGGTVTIRPIAGTRPRGVTAAEDKALEQDLLADPKERSEHLMLLDLGRNDVGRVARQGTVQVTEQFIIERYSHVMHIVSNVTGQLAPGKDALDALMAGFPAGTVSGAPKIRAMQIIDELEPVARRFYGGGVGYFSAGGDMDTCIALRTALIKNGMLHVQAGAGVVADSKPESEYEETRNKAMALLKAAEDCA